MGAKMLRSIPNFEKIASAIETHHENYDGTGYPKGLYTVNLPDINKILRIAVGINNFRELNKSENTDDWQVGHEHLNSYSELRYDPDITKVASAALIEIERKIGNYVIKEIELSELRPGHRLAEDIRQKNSSYLLRQGKMLSAALIDRLNNEIKKVDITDKVKVFIKAQSD